MKKYLRIEKNYPELDYQSINYQETSDPDELFELIKDDEENLINFIINDYNSREFFSKVDKSDLTVEISKDNFEIRSIFTNIEFILFSMRIISESQMILERVKKGGD